MKRTEKKPAPSSRFQKNKTRHVSGLFHNMTLAMVKEITKYESPTRKLCQAPSLSALTSLSDM